MKKYLSIVSGLSLSFILGFYLNSTPPSQIKETSLISVNQFNPAMQNIKLGAFSVSLSVKDLKISKEFYENLGFSVFAGSMESNYLIMKNEDTLIGLFQGMFEGNILTFNPGWDQDAGAVGVFDDVRLIQKHLKDNGIKLETEADEKTSGPASLMLKDPDGNIILIDQHI
ncbi:Catechol 2,3-dioxygenase [Aquiflexum balticum DSM 16537]|uniref:Catechol 2,3-dioxygenase n=1 Tax=Aquiflexum balticum DSM 16537 TaxID=758820 RepID=A0A1W2H5N3_9BACT|nr:Catechol 2,3-dioxygenase [Aquiflexum balticum DSM 16537]